MKDLENILKNAKNKKIEIPHKFTESIEKCFEQREKEYKWRNLYMKKSLKVVATVCACVLIGTGAVFAKDIGNFINNLFKNASKGVNIAVNNGYVANIETEIQEADGIEVNVDSIIMDDYNFAVNFSVSLDKKYNENDFLTMQFEDLKIVDETGKVVFITHLYDKQGQYKGGYNFLTTKKGEREFIVSLSATGSSEAFPKSKYLNITFSKIEASKLVYVDNIEQKEYKYYKGNWNFEVDVPEEFYNREIIIYKAKSCNDSSININTIEATLSKTAFKIHIPEMKTDKVDYDSFRTDTPKSIFDKMALRKEYVETSDGKNFETARTNDGDSGYGVPKGENKIINYYQTFDLTQFDATDNITVHIFTNKGEEIIIEFEK